MKNRVQLFITAVLGFLLGANGSSAQVNQDTPTQTPPQNQLLDSEVQETEPRTRISRREASDIARETFEGRVINIQPDGAIWRIRMDQDGNVFNVMVDANSGRVSRASE